MRRSVVGAGLVVAVLAAACSSDKTKSVNVPACKDIETISTQLNSITDDLAASKALFADIKRTADQLVTDAPVNLKPLAGSLQTAIGTAKPFIDKAKTIDELHQLEQTSSALQTALNSLATYGSQVGDWKTANCKG